MDEFRSRHVTLSCPGDAYYIYGVRSLANKRSDTNDMLYFVYKNSDLKFVTAKIVSAVVAYCMCKK